MPPHTCSLHIADAATTSWLPACMADCSAADESSRQCTRRLAAVAPKLIKVVMPTGAGPQRSRTAGRTVQGPSFQGVVELCLILSGPLRCVAVNDRTEETMHRFLGGDRTMNDDTGMSPLHPCVKSLFVHQHSVLSFHTTPAHLESSPEGARRRENRHIQSLPRISVSSACMCGYSARE